MSSRAPLQEQILWGRVAVAGIHDEHGKILRTIRVIEDITERREHERPGMEAPIRAALARGTDLRKLRASEENLRIALAGERAVSVAIGILMERYRIRAEEAFERLRRYARSRQRKIDDVAKEAVDSVELIAEIGRSPAPEARGNDETL